jgi:hypothetical protein
MPNLLILAWCLVLLFGSMALLGMVEAQRNSGVRVDKIDRYWMNAEPLSV